MVEPLDGGSGVPLTEDETRELISWIEATSSVRVVIVADVVGADSIDARELVREFTGNLGRRILGPDNLIEVEEPEVVGESVRIAVLVGSVDLDPHEAATVFAAATAATGWTEPRVEEHRSGPHVWLEWHAEETPELGITRLEIHAAVGLRLVPEDELPECP